MLFMVFSDNDNDELLIGISTEMDHKIYIKFL